MTGSEQIFKTKINVELLKDLIFKLDFGNPSLSELFIDETHETNSPEVVGPNPSQLLLSAIMGCLNASFAFCLQKSRIPLKGMKAEGEIVIKMNEEGFLRVSEMNIDILPEIEIDKGVQRMEKCIEIFHKYCTITESVRKGIPVNVTIKKNRVKSS